MLYLLLVFEFVEEQLSFTSGKENGSPVTGSSKPSAMPIAILGPGIVPKCERRAAIATESSLSDGCTRYCKHNGRFEKLSGSRCTAARDTGSKTIWYLKVLQARKKSNSYCSNDGPAFGPRSAVLEALK